jgi:Family of unknown function (DUF5752)
MAAPFIFQSEAGAVRSTGYRADDLQSFIHGLERVSGSSIYYHFFRSVYRRHFMSVDYVHDFARWALVSLSLPPLAERLVQLDPVDFVSIREARERLIAATRGFLGGVGDWIAVRPSAPFYFLQQDSLIFGTGQVARNVDEFAEGLATVGNSSIYYHLIQAPIRLGRRENDFSLWLESWGETDLAQAIRGLNVYRSSIPATRNHLVDLVRGNARGRGKAS